MGPRIVIVGAGIAGVSLAASLTLRFPTLGVTLLESAEPLALTTARATGAYRNYWVDGDGAMIALLAEGIDRLEARARRTGNSFHLARAGYAHFASDAGCGGRLEREALELSSRGIGPVRMHSSPQPYAASSKGAWEDAPFGVDVLVSAESIRRQFPYVSPDFHRATHYRRCGFLDPVALGRGLFEEALSRGATCVCGRARALRLSGGRARGVELEDGEFLPADQVVLACGPGVQDLALTAGVDLGLTHEAHWKLILPDPSAVLPEDAPLLILAEPVRLPGESFARPPGVHLRPARREGRREVHILWGYDTTPVLPEYPMRIDPDFGATALAGASRLVPALGALDPSRGKVVGGYYCKAPDNRPLLGPLPVEGLHVLGALSGFGVMVSQAAADRVASLMQGRGPDEKDAPFHPSRFEDPGYLARWQLRAGDAGQL